MSNAREAVYQAVLETVIGRTEGALGRGRWLLEVAPDRRLSDGELDKLTATLADLHGSSNYPVKVVRGEYDGSNWLLGSGANGEDVYITTDRVHASEIIGGADEDGEAWVTLRNAVPQLVWALAELMTLRRTPPDSGDET